MGLVITFHACSATLFWTEQMSVYTFQELIVTTVLKGSEPVLKGSYNLWLPDSDNLFTTPSFPNPFSPRFHFSWKRMTYIHHFTFPLLLRQYHYENIVKIL
jgi:hypothetical protein